MIVKDISETYMYKYLREREKKINYTGLPLISGFQMLLSSKTVCMFESMKSSRRYNVDYNIEMHQVTSTFLTKQWVQCPLFIITYFMI